LGFALARATGLVAVADYLSRFPLKEEIIYDLNNATRNCS
jgi:hypothetical protein